MSLLAPSRTSTPTPGPSSSLSTPPPSSSPGPSGPSTPTPQSEATLYHLLSLPPLLQPLSPPHAALHLARLRLLLGVPADTAADPEAFTLPVDTGGAGGAGGGGGSGSARGGGGGKGMGGVVGGWCNLCGGLRGGQGGAERGPAKGNPHAEAESSTSGDVTQDKEARRQAVRERARARARQTAHLSDAQKEERRMARKLEIADGAAGHREKGKRKAAECTTCGAGWTRPRPDRGTVEVFAGARRTRRQALEAEREKEREKELRAEAKAVADADADAQADEDGVSEPALEEPPTPAFLSHRPYSHIPTSSPNLPSYPPPPPVKTPTPGAGGDAGKKKRKVKKSGLSKLLAENKERSQAAQGSGMWGLG